jgi:hypothetical protein
VGRRGLIEIVNGQHVRVLGLRSGRRVAKGRGIVLVLSPDLLGGWIRVME